MKKSLVERFISKYNIGGAAEAVTWIGTKKGLITKSGTDDKFAFAFIGCSEIVIPEGTYHIYDTSGLKKLLSVLGEDIKIDYLEDERPTFKMTDELKTKTTFTLASEDVIPSAPTKVNEPEFEAEVKMNSKSIDTFIKAKKALTDVTTFAVIADKNVDFVIGYDADNTIANTVSVPCEVVKSKKISPVFFSATYLSNILEANKEATSATISIAAKGLLKVTFEIEFFQVTYYLQKINKE